MLQIINKTESFVTRVVYGVQPTFKDYRKLMYEYMNDEDEVMNIPEQYKELYNKLSLKIKEVGEEILLDCTSSCICKNTPLINCWLMFQSMIASHNLKMEKQEKMFYKFINEQLKLI